jgi:hypothetical protein
MIGVVLLFDPAYATVQQPDSLILEGTEVSLCGYPLEEFFDVYPEKWPESDVTSTSLWRRYIATFTVENGLMSVTNIEIYESFEDNEFQSVIDEVIPDPEDRVMTWFSGNIDILETVESENPGTGSFVTHRKTLQISSGMLVHTLTVWSEEHDDDTEYFCTMGY